jgi:hypothetical protein
MPITLDSAALELQAKNVAVSIPEPKEARTTPAIALEPGRDKRPFRSLALEEILHRARAGVATVHLPLHPQTFKKGPLSVTIPESTEAVIDLAVNEGVIDRVSTRGRIEPPLKLPLGLAFNGLRLNGDGELIADVDNFPDFNLSRVALGGLALPHTLDELLGLIFRREETPSSGPAPIDTSKIRVDAHVVRPKLERFVLDGLNDLTPGEGTILDVDYAPDRLQISGHLVLDDCNATYAGVTVSDVRGEAAARLELDLEERTTEGRRQIALQLAHTRLTLGAIRWQSSGEASVSLEAVEIEGVQLAYERQNGHASLTLKTDAISAKLNGGDVVLRINGERARFVLGKGRIGGRVALDDRGFSGELELECETLRWGDWTVPATQLSVSIDGASVVERTLRLGGIHVRLRQTSIG